MAALALSSAFTAQAAPANNAIVISSIPATRTVAGTYTFESNLSYPNENTKVPAISIGANLAGPVTVDLDRVSRVS